MKKIFFLIAIMIIAASYSQSAMAQTEAQKIDLCTKAAGADATLEKSYTIKLDAARDGERAPVFRNATAMRKGNVYRFTICTDEESSGEAILQLLDDGKVVGTTYDQATGRTFPGFNFECTKSAVYVIFISFKDGREGSAVAILSHVKAL